MKYRIILILTLLIASTCAYSQHLANIMEVDIPLNCTKETAIKKLLNKGFELSGSYDEDDYKLLRYKKKLYVAYYHGHYDVHRWADLYCKNGKITKVSWNLSPDERVDVLNELKSVYDLEPYAETDDYLYFHWKGLSLVVGWGSLDILSNADAETRYQEANQKRIVQQKRLEEQRRQEQQQLAEQRRREQEQLERKRKAEAKRQRETDSIANIERLKSSYSGCRFLFRTEDEFVSCITQKNQIDIENDIKPLLSEKMNEISMIVIKGRELYEDKGYSGTEMLKICNFCIFYSNSNTKNLANYAEKELESFVAARNALTKAYSKAKKNKSYLKCSAFLKSYINENRKNNN